MPFYAWGDSGSRTALVLLHGAGPHGRSYESLARALEGEGVATLTIDQCGFGATTGLRGDARLFAKYLEDCALALEAAHARWPQAKVSLAGHSFGGLVALRYCLDYAGKRGPAPCKLVLIAAWIKDRLRVPWRRIAAGMLDAVVRPTKSYTVPISVFETGDPQNWAALCAFDRDPLRVNAVTARWFLRSARAKLGLFSRSRALRLPVLQLEGEKDALVDAPTNRKLFAALGSSDKRLSVLAGVYHDAQLQADISALAVPIARFLRADSQRTAR